MKMKPKHRKKITTLKRLELRRHLARRGGKIRASAACVARRRRINRRVIAKNSGATRHHGGSSGIGIRQAAAIFISSSRNAQRISAYQ